MDANITIESKLAKKIIAEYKPNENGVSFFIPLNSKPKTKEEEEEFEQADDYYNRMHAFEETQNIFDNYK